MIAKMIDMFHFTGQHERHRFQPPMRMFVKPILWLNEVFNEQDER